MIAKNSEEASIVFKKTNFGFMPENQSEFLNQSFDSLIDNKNENFIQAASDEKTKIGSC